MHIYMYIHTHIELHTYTHTYIHTCTYIHTYYIHTHTYIRTYVRTYTYTHTYLRTYVIRTYIYIHMHIYIYIHTYIHTYTYIYQGRRQLLEFGRALVGGGVSLRGASLFVSRMLLPSVVFFTQKFGGLNPPSPPPLAYALVYIIMIIHARARTHMHAQTDGYKHTNRPYKNHSTVSCTVLHDGLYLLCQIACAAFVVSYEKIIIFCFFNCYFSINSRPCMHGYKVCKDCLSRTYLSHSLSYILGSPFMFRLLGHQDIHPGDTMGLYRLE